VHVGSVVSDAAAEIEQAMASKGQPRGLSTGYRELDVLTGGLREGQLIVVGGRPGMGKSALLINMCDRMAAAGSPVLLFSLEMPAKSIANRIVMARARANSARVRLGAISASEAKTLGNHFFKLADQPLYIDEARGANIMDIRGRARRDLRRHGIKAVFVDYAQLLEAKGYNTSYERVSAVSRGLKAMALELGVPVIAAAQVGRKADERSDTRPKMSDLKDSGSLEQDADIIILLHREGYYEAGSGADSTDNQDAEMIVAKHREGQTRSFPMVWSPSCTRFDHANISRMTDEAPQPYGNQPDLHTINAVLNE
jgi:replicative DNA helicase